MAYCEGIFESYRSGSPSITDSFRAISPLNTPPTDAAPEIWLHDSAKVQGSLNMEDKSTVNGAEELESGEGSQSSWVISALQKHNLVNWSHQD